MIDADRLRPTGLSAEAARPDVRTWGRGGSIPGSRLLANRRVRDAPTHFSGSDRCTVGTKTGPLSGEGVKFFRPRGHSGFTYDQIHDRYLCLVPGSGALLSSVDPDSFACSLLTQGPPAANGCLNRFAFVPILSGCSYLPSWGSEILFLPLA